MIEKFFRELTRLEGIEAIIVYNNQNRIIDSWQASADRLGILTDVGETFLHVFGLLEYLHRPDLGEFCVAHADGVMIARSHPRFYLVIMGGPTLQPALVHLALEVCVGELASNRKARKILKKLPEHKFYQIKTITLDDIEKRMLENILEAANV